jgi:hypothetical protein
MRNAGGRDHHLVRADDQRVAAAAEGRLAGLDEEQLRVVVRV